MTSSPEFRESTVPLPQPLKQKIKDALVAVSLANLCYLKVGFDLLSDHDRFFNKLPVTPAMLLALALNIFCLACLAWLAMQGLRRFPREWLLLPFDLVFLLLLLFPLDFIRLKFFNIADYQIVAFLKQPAAMVGGLALLALAIWKHRPLVRSAAVAVAILSPLAIFLFLKIALVCLGVVTLKQCEGNVPLPPPGPVRAGQPRVVWIIFDETDYRLTFEDRPDSLRLPEFDRLRQQSLYATEAFPPGNFTLLSMPSLVLGRRLSAVDPSDSCDLAVTIADSGATAGCSGLSSVFSDARALGVNTAAVGWYIPYGRLFGASLNFCEWYPYPPFEPSRAENFFADMRQQFDSLGETIHLRQMFIEIHRQSLQTSLSLVTNNLYGLTLLHLPAPHKPGIYLPGEKKFTAWGMPKTTGYFNNLALADRELGELRRAMESSRQWDKTWLILSADHSWRESKVYDNKRDYRVPFLVKPPGATESLGYSAQFNTVLTRDLILAILRGEVTNEQDVAHWVDFHGTTAAPATAKGVE